VGWEGAERGKRKEPPSAGRGASTPVPSAQLPWAALEPRCGLAVPQWAAPSDRGRRGEGRWAAWAVARRE